MREVSVGENLDQYKLIEVIARSGMASIFKAIDQIDGKTVAIKVPYMQFESDVIFYGRFQREEEVGRRLDHPGIVKVLTPKKKSRMYIAMEYIEGDSLRSMMREPGLPQERALQLARQLAETLVYMHGEGVVHRDLKPENILVTAGGQTKVMDFGIALDESARRLTWSGLSSTIGTPDYMAPEQVSGRRGDVRTDIYSLGTILYEMLTGHLPYSGPNVYNVMRAKTAEDPQPPTAFKPELDPHLEEIVLHAIERNPRDRYASAGQMLEDLRDPSQRRTAESRGAAPSTQSRDAEYAAPAWVRDVFHVADWRVFVFDLARKPLPGGEGYSAPVISRADEMMPRRSQIGLAAAIFAALALFSLPMIAHAQTAASSPPLDNSLNLAWLLIAGFLVMFMQLGFAMVETGFTRSKNAVNTMAMNLIIYPIGILGFWLTGYGFMMGGVAHWPSLGTAAIGHHELSITIGAHAYGILGFSKFALLNVSRDPASLGDVSVLAGVHGHRRDHPDRRDGRALEVQSVLHLRTVHVDVPVSVVRQLGVGRRMALAARRQPGPRPRPSRFRGIVGGAHDGRNNRAGRRLHDRSAHRKIPARWRNRRAAGTQPADGRQRNVDSRVRMVRLQLRLNAGRVGSTNRDHRGEHDARVRRRRALVAALPVASLQQTRHRDGLQRPAGRTRRDHGAVRIRHAGGGGFDRHNCGIAGRVGGA